MLTSKAYSNDIVKILSDAFTNNSKLNAERANLDAIKEELNISKGEFLPSITLSGDMATQKDTDRTNYSGTSLEDTRGEPSSRSVVIEQKIFDGFTNYNDVKKSQLELEYSKIKIKKIRTKCIIRCCKSVLWPRL